MQKKNTVLVINMDDDIEETPALATLDRWFSSSVWQAIITMADLEDEASVYLLNEVNDHLCSLTYHLKNKSGDIRIEYEIKYFDELCEDFGVA